MHLAVMRGKMMLGMVICQVGGPGTPIYDELFLPGSALHPIEAHVDCFGALLLHRVVGETNGGGVVHLDGRGRLWMAHFGECSADGNGLLGVEIGGADFGLSCRAHDVGHNPADGMDRASEGWCDGRSFVGVARLGAENKMAACSATGAGDGEVGCVGVDVQPHVAGDIPDHRAGVCVGIVEEPDDVVPSLSGGAPLVQGEAAKGH